MSEQLEPRVSGQWEVKFMGILAWRREACWGVCQRIGMCGGNRSTQMERDGLGVEPNLRFLFSISRRKIDKKNFDGNLSNFLPQKEVRVTLLRVLIKMSF